MTSPLNPLHPFTLKRENVVQVSQQTCRCFQEYCWIIIMRSGELKIPPSNHTARLMNTTYDSEVIITLILSRFLGGTSLWSCLSCTFRYYSAKKNRNELSNYSWNSGLHAGYHIKVTLQAHNKAKEWQYRGRKRNILLLEWSPISSKKEVLSRISTIQEKKPSASRQMEERSGRGDPSRPWLDDKLVFHHREVERKQRSSTSDVCRPGLLWVRGEGAMQISSWTPVLFFFSSFGFLNWLSEVLFEIFWWSRTACFCII